MATERIPIPQIAQSALTFARADFQDIVNKLAQQTLEAMGLPPGQGWVVEFLEGYVSRQVPDAAPATPTPAPPALALMPDTPPVPATPAPDIAPAIPSEPSTPTPTGEANA